MIHFEANLVNELYIMPMGYRREFGICPRTELAHPSKIEAFLDKGCPWDIYEYGDHMFYRSYMTWRERWCIESSELNTTGFYVMTEQPSMFRRVAQIVAIQNRTRQAYELGHWLRDGWHVPFLVSVPIINQNRVGQIVPQSSFFLNNRYPIHAISLDGDDDALTQMLGSEGYTICNGLTLCLALIRQQRINPDVAMSAFKQLTLGEPAPISLSWTNIYLGNTTPHVCDHPNIYGCMGDNPVPACIANLLQLAIPNVPIPQFGNQDIGTITSLQSAMLRFRPSLMQWPTALSLAGFGEAEVGDAFRPDIPSFILGVIHRKKEWRWWDKHGRHYMFHATRAHFTNDTDFVLAWIQPLAQLYATASEHTPRLRYSRIRAMWKALLREPAAKSTIMNALLRKWVIKDTVIKHLYEEGFLVLSNKLNIPYALLKDVFDFFGHDIALHKSLSSVIYTPDSFHEEMHNLFPGMTRCADGGCRVVGTLKHFLKSSTPGSVYHAFYNKYIEKRIAQKLCTIVRAFGMRAKEDNTFGCKYTDANTSLIGFLLLEHLREDKDALVF
jgi:hypothetical protein